MTISVAVVLALFFITAGGYVTYFGAKGIWLRHQHGPTFAYRRDGISYPLATVAFIVGFGTFILGFALVPLVIEGERAEDKCTSRDGTYVDGRCWLEEIEI